MDWIKLHSKKWLFGSGRLMTPDKRGVWVDLLALAAESKLRDGTLRHDIDKPMTRDYIASVLLIDRELLDACIVAFHADKNVDDGKGRIEVWDDGTIEITNWDKYQSQPEHIVAKKISIEKAKETKRRNNSATDRLITVVNQLNANLARVRYEITDEGTILDIKTGEVVTLEQIKNKRGVGK